MRKPFVITGPGSSLEETARIYGVSRKRLKELVALNDKLSLEFPFEPAAPAKKKISGRSVWSKKKKT